MHTRTYALSLIAVCFHVTGCLEQGRPPDVGAPAANATTTSVGVSAELPEKSLAIAGAPEKSAGVGEQFEFSPTAAGGTAGALRFSIANKPAWASFDSATGRLSGTPQFEDVGTYERIRISVTDGHGTAELPAFTLVVTDVATGYAVVQWDPPTENVDGSPLTDLAGFHVYYGRHPDRLTARVDIDNPGVVSVVIENLTPATWYFAVAAYDRDQSEGQWSSVVPYTVP